jgi:alkanesulfonate monooxygenase SsuD/methylene tetrahydromethanopterin reductase-like flavin-dependent oxidoreductase (luciferase family)
MMLLTGAALATTRIKLGPMVTPVPRRRPQQVARKVSTLDNMSGGRVIFGAGLGGPIEDEYGSFGEPTDTKLLAERLDEGLDLLERYWSGEPVTHHGRHYDAEEVTLRPPPVQRPRVPVWVGGYWPNRPPMRRAARWDGAVPLLMSARHGHAPPVDEVRDLVEYVRRHRDGDSRTPFEVVLGGPSPTGAAGARDLLGPLIEAGATWWDERRPWTTTSTGSTWCSVA